MRTRQRGLGWFGSLVVLALTAGAGYYLYQVFVVGDETPSCAAVQQDCLAGCRRSATEAAEAKSCQEACQREADLCASFAR